VHFVIMGCGRVGAALGRSLHATGHSVAVVDQNADAFRRLGAGFEGKTVKGMGFDRDTLAAAGTQDAYAFAAVSSGDNSNILAARVARETFGVENVVARIYDPRRAEVYERLGIPTVATVSWARDQMLRKLLPHGAAPTYSEPSGILQLAEIPLHVAWVGQTVSVIEARTRTRVAFFSRMGKGLLPTQDTIYQDGDLVHLMLPVDGVARVERILAKPPVHDD
jgi:trk system potassium uptake protein TrkA